MQSLQILKRCKSSAGIALVRFQSPLPLQRRTTFRLKIRLKEPCHAVSLADASDLLSDQSNELRTLFLASLAPVLKVCLLSGAGAYLSRTGVLTAEGRRVVSQLVFLVFTPCLIFSKLGETVTTADLIASWPLAANQFVACVAGLAVGYTAAWLSRAPAQLAPQAALATAMGNVGNLPLVLVGTLATDPHLTNILKITDVDQAISYVMIGWFWGSFWQFPLAYLTLRPNAPAAAETPLNADAQLELQPASAGNGNGNGWRQAAAQTLYKDAMASMKPVWPILEGVFTPPTISCLAALYVGSSPFLKELLFSPGGTLKFVGDTADMLGSALIPCMILVLGANLAKGPGDADVSPRLLATVALSRLVLLPAVMTVVLLAALHAHLFEVPNPTFLFVMLLIHTTPTAILVHTIATIHRNGESELSAILFWEYLASAATMPLFMVLYLRILEGIALPA